MNIRTGRGVTNGIFEGFGQPVDLKKFLCVFYAALERSWIRTVLLPKVPLAVTRCAGSSLQRDAILTSLPSPQNLLFSPRLNLIYKKPALPI
jgi:hypothetical protein